MKNKSLLPALVVFAIFLVSGLWTGQRIGRLMKSAHQQSQNSRQMAQDSQNEGAWHGNQSFAPQSQLRKILQGSRQENLPRQSQRNILLIGVNHLEAPSPELEAVWLILYLPDMPQITLMPIYPTVLKDNQGWKVTADSSLAKVFKEGFDAVPSAEFFEALRQKDVRWDNYLLVDEITLIDTIDSLGGLEGASEANSTQTQKTSGIQALAHLLPMSNNSQQALMSQMRLAQQICSTSPLLNASPERLPALFGALQSHLVTDLVPEQAIADLSSMLASGRGITCQFPFISLLPSAQ